MTHNVAKVILITGAAQRVGRGLTQYLHQLGYNIAVHYWHSDEAAMALAAKLNQARGDSAILVQADLCDVASLPALVSQIVDKWGRLDVLVNNASGYYPTPVGTVSEAQWDELLGSNAKGAFFLSQAAADALRQSNGCIINIVDTNVHRPAKGYPIYSVAKAALAMMTQTLAKELAPKVRVNTVSPGVILWPDDASDAHKASLIERTMLKRIGSPEDIAQAIDYLVRAEFVTGQEIIVDGGRF